MTDEPGPWLDEWQGIAARHAERILASVDPGSFSATCYFSVWVDSEGEFHSKILDPREIFTAEPSCEVLPPNPLADLAFYAPEAMGKPSAPAKRHHRVPVTPRSPRRLR